MKATEYARQNRDRYLAELKDFLRIPSISTQPEHRADLERAARWLQQSLLRAGFPRVETFSTPGHPIVYAEWLAAGSGAPTMLIYGHYDVQPPDPLDQWVTPPFEPTVLGDPLTGELHARGASDDKGQLYAHVKAVEALKETVGAPPVNVKCIFEGEEEIGSPSLQPFIQKHANLLAADVAVISDTHILDKSTPSLVYALRGLAFVEVEVKGPDNDLHSGTYGGAVHNPINALCAMIAKLQDAEGHIAIPGFYNKVRALDDEEREELARAPFEREAWLQEAGVKSDWGETAYTIVERTTARPTLDVNGIWGGYIEPGAKTVIPSKAYAKISMRLVPDQEPDEITRLIGDCLAELAPPTVSVKVRSLGAGEGAIVRRDSVAMVAAVQAYATAFGKKPVFVREGGSIPVVAAFQRLLGIETILMGFGLPDDRLHSPNEKFHLPNFYKGIDTVLIFIELLDAEHRG
jgi:acetylornithine deacetylase/succinyl-diaminopimelate desuccinylase-like protein